MDIWKSISYLRRYVKQYIDTSKPTYKSEAGVRGLILLVQEKYKIDMGLPPEGKGVKTDLKDAMLASYPFSRIVELADRKYVSDILLENNIEVDDYVKQIERHNLTISQYKELPINTQVDAGYEITHLIWGLYMICKDNHIIQNYKDFMLTSLINLYNRIPEVNDISTETLYFITLLDVKEIKESWIEKLEDAQDKNGSFPGYYAHEDFTQEEQIIVTAHHTALALLTLFNYYNGITEAEL